MVPWWEYARLGMQEGHREGRAGLPILSGGMWNNFTSLSHRSPGILMYPLQLLMVNVSLATLLATTTQLATPIRRPPTTPSNCGGHPHLQWGPNNDTIHLTRGWPLWDQGEGEVTVLDVTLEEQPYQRQKYGRPLARLLKESHQEAFSKDTEIVKAARQAYHLSHKGMFTQEGSYDLTLIFRQMAQETNLLNAEIHEVQEVWASGWELKAANHAAKASQWDIQFFHTVSPIESPNIMALKGFPPTRLTLVRQPLILPLMW